MSVAGDTSWSSFGSAPATGASATTSVAASSSRSSRVGARRYTVRTNSLVSRWLPMRLRRQYSLLLPKAAIVISFTCLILYQIRDPTTTTGASSSSSSGSSVNELASGQRVRTSFAFHRRGLRQPSANGNSSSIGAAAATADGDNSISNTDLSVPDRNRAGPGRGGGGGGGQSEAGEDGSTNRQPPAFRVRLPAPEPSSYLRSYVAELNRMQTIHNEMEFGPLADGDVVIVVQVHNRWTYLEALIESLRVARGINQTLLIFSHDFYDAAGLIEELPNMVTFTKMMQIFYPSSIQLEPNRFPGDHPNDCPRDANRAQADELGCENAAYPDRYGHYREGKFCQTKHHWWWKANRVMDALNVTAKHNGPFVFLEEDHYVTPDVLHVLRKMELAQPTACPECRIFVMGTYLKSFVYRQFGATVDILKWASSRHNMGMVLYRELWREVRDRCAHIFCTYDDYNWDWSLYRVSMTCLTKPLMAMVVHTTRVFHVGECGVHHKGKNCDQSRLIRAASQIISASGSFFFPKSIQVQKGIQRSLKAQKPNGGWGDIRDHQLCMHFLNETL